ncbi:MAG: glycosyltransferase [Chloroflexi bacterium]|nr:glycosyltransferase [Chloroflexota bacterium]
MRLLLLSSEFPPGPGGIGTHAYQLALRLGDLGWQAEVITRQDTAPDPEIAAFNSAQPFAVHRLLPAGSAARDLIYRVRTMLDVVRRFQPDVIVASGRPWWLAALTTPIHRRPGRPSAMAPSLPWVQPSTSVSRR